MASRKNAAVAAAVLLTALIAGPARAQNTLDAVGDCHGNHPTTRPTLDLSNAIFWI